jgi:putative peptide zinc metalloprotease protein
MKLHFNPAVSIHPFDSSSSEPMALCDVPLGDGAAKKYVIPFHLLDMLKQFDGCKETAEVIAAYQDSHPGKHSTKSVENLIESFLVPKGLLIAPNSGAPPLVESSKRKSALYIRLPIIPPRVVAPIATAMSWLFIRPILLCLFTLFVIAHIAFYATILPGYHFSLNSVRGPDILVLYALSTLTALFHEFGHASALHFYDCKRAEIGWGLYLIYPVLYTDVSDAWRLKRSERAVINIAGIYFQCIPLIILALIFLHTKSPILLYSIIIINMEMISALNPFLRNDGYWLVTDLFGIHNLRQQSFDLLKRSLMKIFPPKRKATLPPWNLSRKASVILGVYILTGTAFALYLFTIIARLAIFEIAPNYPSVLLTFWNAILKRPFELMPVAVASLDVQWRGLVLLGLALFVLRTLKAIWGGVKGLANYLMENGK